jgi:hypothetical protein
LANAIDRVKQDIQKRLTELEAERDQLLKALDALTGGSSPLRRRGRPRGSGSASGNGRRRSGRRAPRGQRREQVLAVLEGKELGPSAIARDVGVNPTQISSILRQLASEGRVSRTAGGQWKLTAAAAESQPTPGGGGEPGSSS